MEASTEDGRLYWFHRVSRVSRWTRPIIFNAFSYASASLRAFSALAHARATATVGSLPPWTAA